MATNPKPKPIPAEKTMRDASSPDLSPQRKKNRILVVDDDPQIRESLRKVLSAEGYEVALAADGQEGIEQFSTERIDLLLLDLNLPGNSGWDLFGTLTYLNPVLPIIIITGRQNQQQLAAGAGVGALMQKPLDVPRLVQTITELLAESAETRLKRLVGLHHDVHYVPPLHLAAPDTRSTKRRSSHEDRL
jgi:DNA-binding response OmpR family regulator